MQILDEMKPQQSPELLKSLHILTRDGKINQDSRRKLKQVYHLYNFIEPILEKLNKENEQYSIVDHGCGKSYLGFILYDLFIKQNLGKTNSNFLDAYLLLVVDSLKNKDFDNANKFISKALNISENNRFDLAILESLEQYVYVFKENKILNNKKSFGIREI